MISGGIKPDGGHYAHDGAYGEYDLFAIEDNKPDAWAAASAHFSQWLAAQADDVDARYFALVTIEDATSAAVEAGLAEYAPGFVWHPTHWQALVERATGVRDV